MLNKINREILTAKQVKDIISYVETTKGSQIAMMFKFCFYCGMRQINFRTLKVNQVIDENGKAKDIIFLTEEQSKGHTENRYYVSQMMKKEIEQYCKEKKQDSYLFISQKGTTYLKNSICRIFQEIFKTFNLNSNTHQGRHYFITSLLEQGTSINYVASMVNHKNIQTTNSYVIENPNVLNKIVSNAKL